MTGYPAGEIIPGSQILQIFRAKDDFLSSLHVTIGTFQSVQDCHLTFSVHEASPWQASLIDLLCGSDAGSRPMRLLGKLGRRLLLRTGLFDAMMRRLGILCAESVLDCRDIADNSEAEIFFEPRPASRGKSFVLMISSADGRPGRGASIHLDDKESRIEGHVWCSVGTRHTGAMGLQARAGFARPTVDSPIPPALLISLTTQCNLNCIHCISQWTRKGVHRLSPDIRRLLQSWADRGWLASAATDYSGDILWSDRRFGGDLDFLCDLGIGFHLDTNGNYLDQAAAQRLMGSKVLSVNVSLDAARDATYRRIRVGALPLAAVKANMRLLAQERMRAARPEVRLSLSVTLMRSNIDELPEAIDLARDVGFDMVVARHLEAYTARMADESLWHDRDRFNTMRDHALAHAARSGIALGIAPPFPANRPRRGHQYCPEPWRSAVVLGNGDVQVCCVPGPEMRMGNLHEETMEAIWNGPRYRQFRTAVNSAHPPAACDACPMYRKLNNPDSYMPGLARQAAGDAP